MLVILDRGHGQKPDGFDPGCVAGALREVDIAADYIRHAGEILTAAGHDVRYLDSGGYDARHRQALAWAATTPGPALYVQCHVNAGGGGYGLVEFDRRSAWGSTAAMHLAHALIGLVGAAKTNPLDPGERGWVCIDDIYASPTMCGLIYEPGFIDTPAHAALWTAEGRAKVGAALAAGIAAYAAGRA